MCYEPEVVEAPRRKPVAFLLVLVLALLASCASSDAYADIRKQPPCPITLAIDVPTVAAAEASAGSQSMTVRPGEMQDLLVRGLRKVRAASRVVPLSELASPSDADVVLRPTLRQTAPFEYIGCSDSWWASGGLWLVTWIGGMAVNDSSYRANMEAVFQLEFPQSERRFQQQMGSRDIDLSFLQRNDLFSWPTVQSFVLPPFWTTDQLDTTTAALTGHAVDDVAAKLGEYLKQQFEDESKTHDLCSIGIESPVNGATVTTESVKITGVIRPAVQITSVQASLNGGSEVEASVVALADGEGGDGVDRAYQRRFRVNLRGLNPGENFVRITVQAGDEYTRTLTLIRN